jgi:hypothetical protein
MTNSKQITARAKPQLNVTLSWEVPDKQVRCDVFCSDDRAGHCSQWAAVPDYDADWEAWARRLAKDEADTYEQDFGLRPSIKLRNAL